MGRQGLRAAALAGGLHHPPGVRLEARRGGTRLYRRVIIWVPRKNGKTELLAGVSHLCLLGDAVWGAECYSIASVGNQAEIILDRASQMVAYSPELAAEYEVFSNSLYIPARRSIFQALTGKPKGKHGLSCAYLLGDEVHEWENDKLYTYVRNSMASREQPMEWLISTFGIEEGYGLELYEESLKICEGAFDDPETLVLIWCAPQDPKAEIDLQDPGGVGRGKPELSDFADARLPGEGLARGHAAHQPRERLQALPPQHLGGAGRAVAVDAAVAGLQWR